MMGKKTLIEGQAVSNRTSRKTNEDKHVKKSTKTDFYYHKRNKEN